MDRRLPPQEDEWIDRSQPIEFRFEGRTYGGFAGDVLSSALWANDVRMLGRSFKYHRPRGVYSMAGHDANVIVEDAQRTNMRGDMLPISHGLDVRAVNTSGSLENDRLRLTEWFSRMLPVGFYYKAFHTPRRLFPFYERQMRNVAGLGRINPNSRPQPSPKDYTFCDLLVVGAGPSGLSAAIAAGEQGLQVLVVEEQARPGGSLAWQRGARIHDSSAGPGTSATNPQESSCLRPMLKQIEAMDNIELRCGTQAAAWYADHWIPLLDQRRLTKLRAKSVLVAAGCFEQPAVFQNNDLPGVMLGSAAQRLIFLYSIRPFDRATVLAANSDGYRVALDLHRSGVEVAAIIDPRPEGELSDLARDVADAGLDIHHGHVIQEAIPAAGKKRIQGAVVSSTDGNSPRRIACDGIVQSVGWAPNAALLYQSGGRLTYQETLESFVPAWLPDGVFAAGRVNGVFDLQAQITDGHRAGLTAAAYLGREDRAIPDLAGRTDPATRHNINGPQLSEDTDAAGPGDLRSGTATGSGDPCTAPDVPVARGASPSHPYPVMTDSQKKSFVDLDEDVHLADFKNAHQEGYDNIELMKRFTTVGMGPSQGKLSSMNAVRILARLNGASIEETGSTTSRPFHHPAPVGHLAGRRFHPLRRTPAHDWHVSARAKMTYAGAWLRPEYYQSDGLSRDDCIFAEAMNVRENVGLIDVGTLGKLYVQGPDAVKFLEHIYTGRFAKQKLGRLRYGIACDEAGIIIEDGVVARLADNTFYVTATSSGVAAFYRDMQRWALIFGMDVTLVNATGQLTAMNLAGPGSRSVLEPLTDIDLAPEAFPYSAVREATVAGVPAALMRVGFVGELGYEIHVSAASGHHVWTSLMRSGHAHGIRPFGVEAQRLLRLEKGHLIVGHDTDALTNPFEADVAWAIGKNKTFFIGSRSLEIAREKPLTRRLAGLTFSVDQAGQLPEECNLIIDDGEIAGRITSIGRRSSLGHPIAMAFVEPDLAVQGTRLKIRLDNGSMVEAEVAAMPFYDPENARQK